jgi:hypothetical protein
MHNLNKTVHVSRKFCTDYMFIMHGTLNIKKNIIYVQQLFPKIVHLWDNVKEIW